MAELDVPSELWGDIKKLTERYNSRKTKKRKEITPEDMAVCLLYASAYRELFIIDNIRHLLGMVKEARGQVELMRRQDWRAFWMEQTQKALEEERRNERR